MFDGLYRKYKDSGIVEKYIFCNVAVYIILLFIGVFSVLFNSPEVLASVKGFLELPALPGALLLKPWTLFAYMFVHADVWHILWNMLALYCFGRIFLNFYSVRHFAGTYILGGLFGAMFFVAAYNLFPYFKPFAPFATLVGASAAVIAVIVASAVRSPGYKINLLLIGSVRLSAFAIFMVLLSFLLLSGDNAGGNFAHLGGAFAGWLIAYMLNKGVDLTNVVNKPIDWLSAPFRRSRVSKRKKKFVFAKGGRGADYEYNARKRTESEEVDRILEKIKKSGYAALSEEEKKRLFDASAK